MATVQVAAADEHSSNSEEPDRSQDSSTEALGRCSLDDSIGRSSDALMESDDDEELLAPSICFTGNVEKGTRPAVATPEKALAPLDGSPLTPLCVHKPSYDKDIKKYRLTFDKLTADKSRRKDRDAELAKMEALLEEKLQKGGISHLEDDTCDKDEDVEKDGMGSLLKIVRKLVICIQ